MSCSELSRRRFLHRGSCGMLTLALGLAGDVILPVSAVAGGGGPSEKSYPIPAAELEMACRTSGGTFTALP